MAAIKDKISHPKIKAEMGKWSFSEKEFKPSTIPNHDPYKLIARDRFGITQEQRTKAKFPKK